MNQFSRLCILIFLSLLSLVTYYRQDMGVMTYVMRGLIPQEEVYVPLPLTADELFIKRMEKLHVERFNQLNQSCCKYGRCMEYPGSPHGHDFYCDAYKVIIDWRLFS